MFYSVRMIGNTAFNWLVQNNQARKRAITALIIKLSILCRDTYQCFLRTSSEQPWLLPVFRLVCVTWLSCIVRRLIYRAGCGVTRSLHESMIRPTGETVNSAGQYRFASRNTLVVTSWRGCTRVPRNLYACFVDGHVVSKSVLQSLDDVQRHAFSVENR